MVRSKQRTKRRRFYDLQTIPNCKQNATENEVVTQKLYVQVPKN